MFQSLVPGPLLLSMGILSLGKLNLVPWLQIAPTCWYLPQDISRVLTSPWAPSSSLIYNVLILLYTGPSPWLPNFNKWHHSLSDCSSPKLNNPESSFFFPFSSSELVSYQFYLKIPSEGVLCPVSTTATTIQVTSYLLAIAIANWSYFPSLPDYNPFPTQVLEQSLKPINQIPSSCLFFYLQLFSITAPWLFPSLHLKCLIYLLYTCSLSVFFH